MNNLLQQLTETFLSSQKPKSFVILFDSIASASELAFMLGGEWDNCNSVTLTKYDRESVKEAAALIEAKWCRCGDSVALLPKVAEKVLLERYKTGERYFINANLRCSLLSRQCLKGASLSHAFLNEAHLTETDLSDADLSAADASGADLTRANLKGVNLFRTNLTKANLTSANLKGARLQKACLKGANLSGANLDGADLTRADLRGAELNNISLNGANLTGTMLTVERLPN
jgi:uncharacterized protein YjbI with pentapeptide repeats